MVSKFVKDLHEENPYAMMGEPIIKEVVKMGKGFLWSKTVWVNMLTAGVSIATYFMNSDLLGSNPELVAGIGTVIGVVNVILRLVTKKPITSIK